MSDPECAAVLRLLADRAPGATVCPSEVARVLAPGDGWRDAMPRVHAAVDRLLGGGDVRLTWRGRRLAVRVGAYRIGRAEQTDGVGRLPPSTNNTRDFS